VPGYADTAQQLINVIDDYFYNRALKDSPSDVPIWLMRSVSDTNMEMRQLLEANGYQLVRYFYTMRIDFDQPIEPIPTPEGFTLRPIDVERDGQAVYDAQQDAFRDHWGYYVEPFSEWIYPTTQPGFDPNLWWVAFFGNDVAGMALGEARTADYGWIGTVGVRELYRQKRLGLALLQRALASFQQKGVKRVELGVDAENTYKAVALYERAGMHVANRRPIYRKTFRAG
jgi:mycothiol synthase